jgi:hypothetical protein
VLGHIFGSASRIMRESDLLEAKRSAERILSWREWFTEQAPEAADAPPPSSDSPAWRLALRDKGIELTDEEAALEEQLRSNGVHCMFYPSTKKRRDALAEATVKVLREAGEKRAKVEAAPSLYSACQALLIRLNANAPWRDERGYRLDEMPEFAEFSSFVQNPGAVGQVDCGPGVLARLIYIVEGVGSSRWQSGGARLKDTREWCAFYSAVKAAEREAGR